MEVKFRVDPTQVAKELRRSQFHDHECHVIDDWGRWRWECSCGGKGQWQGQSANASVFQWFKHAWRALKLPWPRYVDTPAEIWWHREQNRRST